MSVASDLRDALTTALQPALISAGLVDPVFEIVPGRLEGPQTDKDRGSVWVDDIEEDSDTRVMVSISAHLRVFKRAETRRGRDLKPFDPAELEDIGEYVQTSLNGSLQSLGVWQCRVARQQFDLEAQMIEIEFAALHGNLGIRNFP